MPDFAAVDLGAESGRVVRGRFDGKRVELEVAHRFENRPVRLPDGLHWNLLSLFAEILGGLRELDGPLAGVAVDTWGVDYALLDDAGRVLGLPYHYRDSRTDGVVARAHERVPRTEMYEVTGIQTMPINTVFQLLADDGTHALAGTARIALVPDLISSWLSGELVNEVTNASTTGLLDARSGTWARALIERLGLPAAPFEVDPVEPGLTLGPLLDHHGVDAPVHLVASHDTASAYVAAPVRSANAAILSSGTWSLLGLELEEPVLNARACEYNLTNERGVDGTIRLLRNVMGLWLVQECAKRWGASYEELRALAEQAPADVPLFDPDDEGLLRPGDMPTRVAEACAALGQDRPSDRGEIVRSILVSLACKYRLVLERLEAVTGRDVDAVHVIGGGVRNELLCALTADVLGRPVLAGPVEATALGNVLGQARAVGELGSLADMRAVAAASAEPALYEPAADRAAADATYERFLAVTTKEAVR
jgi:rhamnulokinase